MTPRASHKSPRGGFSDAYRRMLGAAAQAGVGEAAHGRYAGIALDQGERLLRCIWFDQYLRTDALRTEDGRKLEVVSPGWWNAAAGPDFQNAEFRLDNGPTQRADVEAHIAASDWYSHGHDHDPAYAGVGLHVVLESDRDDAFVAFHDGRRIPQLVAGKFLSQELDEIAEATATEAKKPPPPSPGGCREAVQSAGALWVASFLDHAGDERIVRKAEGFLAQLTGRTLDDVLLEGLFDALGYRTNRRAFRRLARRLPVAELKRFVAEDAEPTEKALALEAILFGVAGLLREPADGWDQESREYHALLLRCWQPVAAELGGRALRRADWNFAATRPLNRPERRLAAAAQLLAHALHVGLFRALLSCIEQAQSKSSPRQRGAAALRLVQSLFRAEASSYWTRRCLLGGKPLAAACSLLGPERAAAMAVNVVIPLIVCEARRSRDFLREEQVHTVYAALPPLAENFATRYVAGRIFSSQAQAKAVAASARRQQGLLQLYADFCHFPAATCERCLFHHEAEGARGKG